MKVLVIIGMVVFGLGRSSNVELDELYIPENDEVVIMTADLEIELQHALDSIIVTVDDLDATADCGCEL